MARDAYLKRRLAALQDRFFDEYDRLSLWMDQAGVDAIIRKLELIGNLKNYVHVAATIPAFTGR